jgi:dUTPase
MAIITIKKEGSVINPSLFGNILTVYLPETEWMFKSLHMGFRQEFDLGIRVTIDPGYTLMPLPRSYVHPVNLSGRLKVVLFNDSRDPVTLSHGQEIMSYVVVPVAQVDMEIT